MKVKFLFPTLVILLATTTFFAVDTIADSGSADNTEILMSLAIVLIPVAIVCVGNLLARKTRTFLKVHRRLLSSEDPKVLLELSEKCDAYLKDRNSSDVRHLAQKAKDKREKIQKEMTKLETFQSEISEDGLHLAVVATLKEQMHNPDSFQHVSSHYEIVEKEDKFYHKIVMTFRGTNTFNALVLQTCYFLVDADIQVTLVGSPDDSESSPVNSASLSESIDAAASAFEGVAAAADLLSFFTSDDE